MSPEFDAGPSSKRQCVTEELTTGCLAIVLMLYASSHAAHAVCFAEPSMVLFLH
jgi:hypothetical protein